VCFLILANDVRLISRWNESRRVTEALLPAADCDVMSGRDQIARWFGLTCGQCSIRKRTTGSETTS